VYLKWSFGDEAMQKLMTIWQLPERQRITGPPPGRKAEPNDAAYSSEPRSCGFECSLQVQRLAPQTINGVYAEGSRSTRTFNAGNKENGQPMMVSAIHEVWRSPELAILVRQLHDEPSTGRTHTELTDIVATEPDPALFTPPENYQVRDMRQNAGQR
jgi:hypothetical protein